jgi:phage shock protein PspC (stress-responsive transcriptional regulator)
VAFKFKSLSWASNAPKYVMLALMALCLAVFQYLGVALSILLYIVFSLALPKAKPSVANG